MAAAQDNRPTDRAGKGALAELKTLPVAAGVRIYRGTKIGSDGSGNARPMGSIPGLTSEGIAKDEADNTNGAAGAVTVDVIPGVFKFANSSGSALVAADAGSPSYAEDDQTARKGDGDGRFDLSGTVVQVDANGVREQIGRASGLQIVERKLLLTHGAGNGTAKLTATATTQSFNLGAILPDCARLLGGELGGFTAFAGGGAGSCTMILGGTDDDGIIASTSIFTGATGWPKFATAGAQVTAGRLAQMGGQQIVVKVTCDVNVVLLTTGALSIRTFWLLAA